VIVWVAKEGGKPEPVMPVAEIPLKGAHNVENVLAAVCAARLAGIPAESRFAVGGEFQAVEHRLEFVRTVNGVEYYNDSKATNVDAAMKAVASFGGRDSPDSWREGQGLGLHAAGAAAAGTGEGCLHDWFGGGKD
jgi:UDP-N-acetylmuramoylalanine--D-glutamate ligase